MIPVNPAEAALTEYLMLKADFRCEVETFDQLRREHDERIEDLNARLISAWTQLRAVKRGHVTTEDNHG